MPLRYGENPHQQAALYLPVGPHARGVAQAEQVQGKELSYNNLNDANAALELVAEFRDGEPTVVIVKHANPCGVATRGTLIDAWREALACDSVSAFGGIVATNRPLDAATAEAITADLHRSRRRARRRRGGQGDLREEEEPAAAADRRAARSGARRARRIAIIAGGILVQDRDNGMVTRDQLKCVTKRQPTEQELARLPVRLDRRQARQVERDRLCQGRGHRRHRRRPDEPPRQRADRRASAPAKPPRPMAGPSRARSARRSRPTPSSRSPTGCSPPPKPARPR